MATVSTNQNLNAVTRTAGEDITITSGAILTIDAQVPADVTSLSTNLGSVICITSGQFNILNNSTTTPIVVQVSANSKDLRFEKNGKIYARGNAIQLGAATGSASESFSFSSAPLNNIPYPTHVEVETASGSDDYLPYWVVPVAGYTVNWATTGFAGGDYPVGRVLFWNATTRQLTAGDGTNGNLLPTGAKLRIPNIYFHSASTNATPASRSLIDLNPSGSMDCEWLAFSERWYFANTTFNQLRMVHCGWGTHFSATSSNGSVELDHFSIVPDTEQTTVATNFDINLILGYCKLQKISAITAGLVTGNTRIRFGQLFALDPMVSDINVARKDGVATSADEAMIIQNVPAGTDFRRLNIAGGRVELTNLANIRFVDCGVARSVGTAQVTAGASNAWFLTNCVNIKYVNGGMSGPSVCRNQWISVDSQSSFIQAFNLYFDCGDNATGMVTSSGADVEFYNCQFPNIRTTGINIDSPTTFLSSNTNARNCKVSGSGTVVLEATQNGIYDVVGGTPNDFTTTYSGATKFAFANVIDLGLSATTGNLVCGPFGAHDELTFSGDAQLDQAGSIELFNSGAQFEVESYFDMHAITAFQNASLKWTYTQSSTVSTDTNTAPDNVTFEFRLRTPSGSYGSYITLDPTNLSTAISALTGYDSDEGLRMQIRGTATSTDTTRLITQIIMATNIDTNWVAPDANLTIRGADATDITTMYRFSDDQVIDVFVGSGTFQFLASPYFEQDAYFIRRNDLGFEIMRTRSAPQAVILGNNGFVDLFAGAQVQLAQSADVSAIRQIVEAYLDDTISSRLATIDSRLDYLDSPISQAGGSGIVVGGAPAFLMTGFNLISGSVSSGSIVDTYTKNGTYHTIVDSAGLINIEYSVNIGLGATASNVYIYGRLAGNGDNIDLQIWDNVSSAWVTFQTILGSNSGANFFDQSIKVFARHVSDIGDVKIKFTGIGLTSAVLDLDQIFVEYVPVPTEVGRMGVAQGGTATTITLDAGASSINDYYYPSLVTISKGTGINQYARTTGYNGTTKVLTVATPWAVNPDSTSHFHLQPWGSVRMSEIDTTPLNDIRTGLALESTLSNKASQSSVDGKPTLAQIEGSTVLAKEATSTSIKAKTDLLSFTGTDVKATLDGEEVVTDIASRNASKATGFATPANVTDARDVITGAISALNDFDPTNDVVAHVTLVDTTTTNTDMRGTNGAITSLSGIATATNVSDAQMAIIDELASIKGAGWTTETLKDIRENVGVVDLSPISNQLDDIEATQASSEANILSAIDNVPTASENAETLLNKVL